MSTVILVWSKHTYIVYVSTPASTYNFLEHVEWEILQCNILLWMKVQLYLRYV